MFGSIKDDLLRNLRSGNMVVRLVLVNVLVFVFLTLLGLIFRGLQAQGSFYSLIHIFSISSGWKELLLHPWAFLTAGFIHLGFWHLLFNMFGLYLFGEVVGDLIGDRHILPVYVLGGIATGLLFFISASVFSLGHGNAIYAFGASGPVMAIAAAAGMLAPDYEKRLVLFGRVKLKYIVGVFVLLNLVLSGGDFTTGGHLGLIGGFLFGFLYIHSIRNGQDLGAPFNRAVDNIRDFFRGSPAGRTRDSIAGPRSGKSSHRTQPDSPMTAVDVKPRKTTKPLPLKVEELDQKTFQEHLDTILDKIRLQGFDSLSQEEKDFLNQASKR